MPDLTQMLTSHARPIVAGLLVVYGALAWTGVREKSTTYDEMAHLTAGYSYWLAGDYRLNPESGVLPQRWAALPLLAQDLQFPDTQHPHWWQSDVWNLGHEFFHTLGNDLDTMLWWGRGMIVLVGMALGLVVYVWSRCLFGPLGGTISLLLYVFCPSCLAHGSLATADMAATLAFTLSLGCIWMTMHRVTIARVLLSSLALGGLFVAKMSAVLIVPVGLLLVGIRLVVGRPLIVGLGRKLVIQDRRLQLAILTGVAVLHAVIVAGVIWAFYGFQFSAFREAEANRDQMYGGQTIDSLTDNDLVGNAVIWAYEHRLLPEVYLHGFAYTVKTSQGRYAFLHGEQSTEGWKRFFPYCLVVKTPLAVFAVLLAAAAAVAAQWSGRARRAGPRPQRIRGAVERGLYRTLPIWVFLAVYWCAAIFSHLNIGHRHILPTYPLMFILCGAAAGWFRRGSKVAKVFVTVALAALVVESLVVYPHYLAYFNQLAGGPRHGYRHLVDSSLDWGQDLPGLKRWLAEKLPERMKDKPVYLSYFGTGSPKYYGLDVLRLPGVTVWERRDFFPLGPGTYCISATMLQCVYTQPRGNWNPEHEKQYRLIQNMLRDFAQRKQADPQAHQRLLTDPAAEEERARWNALYEKFDHLRFVRLCDYLRRREPDDSVGYSILIYYLNEQDLEYAAN